MDLRPYQTALIWQFYNALPNHRAICLQLATGAGKTPIGAKIICDAVKAGIPVLFLAHREELITQAVDKLQRFGVMPGIIKHGYEEDRSRLCQVASYQSLANRELPRAGFVVFDECHLNLDAQIGIVKEYPKAKILGLTATPYRLDGRGLNCVYDSLITGPSVKWLIRNGFLSKYRTFISKEKIDTSKIKVFGGDYSISGLARAVNKPKLRADLIGNYKQYAYGKKALVFCVDVSHSKHVFQQYRDCGITAEQIDGNTSPGDRRDILGRLKAGKTKVLTNCEIATVGFDLPDIEVVQLARPTKSLALALQMIGRVLRPSPGKHSGIILDHAGIISDFGFPDDHREWSLTGNPTIEENKRRFKRCKQCGSAIPNRAKVCNVCNYVYEQNPRSIMTLVDVDDSFDLVEDWSSDSFPDITESWDQGIEDHSPGWDIEEILLELSEIVRDRLFDRGVSESVVDRVVRRLLESKELIP